MRWPLPLLSCIIALPLAVPATAEIVVAGWIEGGGAAAAEVTLEAVPNGFERTRLRLAGALGPPPVGRAEPDEKGFFELAVPAPGMWRVVVAAPGAAVMEYRLEPLVESRELPPLRLAPAVSFELRVVDPRGRPRQAAVGAYSLSRGRSQDWRTSARLLRSDEQGIAVLLAGKGETLRVEARAEGFAPVSIDVGEPVSEGAWMEVRLRPGATGTVTVEGSRGRPAAGAIAFQGSGLLPFGATDEAGRLELTIDPSQPLRCASADGGTGGAELDFEGAAKVRLEPPRTIRGRILDAATREVLPDALVWAVRGWLAETDNRGGFELVTPAQGRIAVRAVAAGYGLEVQRNEARPGEEVALALPPVGALAGVVVDGEGEALAGVEVRIVQEMQVAPALSGSYRRWSGAHSRRGRSSPGGRFRISGLLSGVRYELLFEKPGFAPRSLQAELPRAGEPRRELRVVLAAGRRGVGRVVDEADAPVAGAEVRLLPALPAQRMRLSGMHAGRGDGVPSAQASDAEGRFTIPDLAAGRYDLEVLAAGFAPASVPGVQVAEGEGAVDLGTVILVAGATVEGEVRDPQGTAIAGAEIRVQSSGGAGFRSVASGGDGPAATSDAAGRFEIVDQRPGKRLALAVTKAGYSSSLVSGVEAPTSEPLEVVLRPAARLAGRVVDERQRPIAGAYVSAMMQRSMIRGRRQRPAETDAEGRFEIADVEPGTLMLHAQAAGYQQGQLTGLEVPAGGELAGLEIVLRPGATVEGRVRDAAGEPVAGVKVGVVRMREGSYSSHSSGSESDAEGRYRVEGLAPGPVTVTAEVGGQRRASKQLEVRPGRQTVDLVLEEGLEVAGRVVDPAAEPVAGALVSLDPSGDVSHRVFYPGSAQPVTSGADGGFRFIGVPAGRYSLGAIAEGFARLQRGEAVVVDGFDVTGLTLHLERGATLSGRVSGADLDELASIVLHVYGPDGDMRRARVDYEGRYRVESLGHGVWQVQARSTASGRRVAASVVVAEGASEVELDLELGTGFTLSGVALADGAPLVGARIFATGEERNMGQAMTDSQGRFRIEQLAAGSYQVVLSSSDGSISHMQVVEIAGDREITLEIASGSVAGLVLDGIGGQPLAHAQVVLERLDPAPQAAWPQRMFGGRAESDSQGRFRLRHVREGSWRLVASREGYGPAEVAIEVRGGLGVEGLELRLQPAEGITFEVALPGGAPAREVQAAVLAATGRRLVGGRYQAGEQGRFRISMVPAGSWELLLQAGGSAASRHPFIAPGHLGRLQLSPGGALHLVVTELEGSSEMTTLALTGPDGRLFQNPAAFGPQGEWPMAGGTADVPHLPPGPWSFTVRHVDGRRWSGSATIVAGATAQARLP